MDEILKIFNSVGDQDYIGEAVTQKEHAEQAALFGTRALKNDHQDNCECDECCFNEECVVGAMLHDIGHLLGLVDPNLKQMEGNLGVVDHERLGASFLVTLGFPKTTTELVRRHVDAKRYLCWKNPSYLKKLSEASMGTLKQQGGPMNDQEAANFEQDPLKDIILKMRTWDEAAKVVEPTFQVPTIESYRPMIERILARQKKRMQEKEFKFYKLNEQQMKFWEENGYILLSDLLSEELKKDVVSWVQDIQSWPETPGKHMCYFEKDPKADDENNKTLMLCRTENFLPYHEHMEKLLTAQGPITDVLEQLMNEPAVLFKEKINYKLAGGGGFPAHQDAPAFTSFGQRNHLTLNVSIDESTNENGCLQVAPGHHRKGLFPQNPLHGGLSDEEESKLGNWIDVPMKPGDVLLFSSWLPHRSQGNRSQASRRALYITYNGETDGSFRDQYYEVKRKEFPQACEREEGKDYSEAAKTFNLATPIVG